MQRRNRQMKDFLYANMYRHHRVVRMAVKAERIITDLFNAYQEEPSMLPQHVQDFIGKRGLERTICDYLSFYDTGNPIPHIYKINTSKHSDWQPGYLTVIQEIFCLLMKDKTNRHSS